MHIKRQPRIDLSDDESNNERNCDTCHVEQQKAGSLKHLSSNTLLLKTEERRKGDPCNTKFNNKQFTEPFHSIALLRNFNTKQNWILSLCLPIRVCLIGIR